MGDRDGPGQAIAAAPSSAPPLVPVAELVAGLAGSMPPSEPVGRPLADAAGLILAEPLLCPGPVPPQAIALRPGWAVDAASLAGASPYSPVPVARPVRVRAGDALPPGTDAVLPFEALAGTFPEATADVPPGEGVRRAGEEVAAGAALAGAGERLSPLAAALAAAAGIERCRVRRPEVAVVGPGREPSAAYLARFAAAEGARVSRAAALPGDAADLVVVADLDLEAAVERLLEAGATVLGRPAARPGEGVACAILQGRPVLVVEPRLPEAVAAALLLVRPCLARATGARPPRTRAGPLTRKLASAVGLTDIALVRGAPGGGLEPVALGDLTLSALARAEAWLAIPPDSEGWPAGTLVEVTDL